MLKTKTPNKNPERERERDAVFVCEVCADGHVPGVPRALVRVPEVFFGMQEVKVGDGAKLEALATQTVNQ